jgi:beta-fructofuranosidase
VTYYAVSDSIDGPFVAPKDNILDGKGMIGGNGFVFYAPKTAEIDGNTYLCGWIGRAGLSSDSGVYQWAGNVMIHQLVQHENGTLRVKAPEPYDDFFTVDKPFRAEMAVGEGKISGNNISLFAEEGSYSVADMGTRPASMTLECDVTIDEDGCAGFAFGGSEEDAAYTALCLDAKQNLLHYEGYEISDLDTMEPQALTKFDFSQEDVHHVKLVCENEIVVLYVDDVKALSSRITHSIGGAHIGVFSNGCGASFENITMKLSE